MKVFVSTKRKIIITNITVYFLILFLLTNSSVILESISTSLELFIFKLIPSLFPYILITEVLINSNIIYTLSYGLSKIISKIFQIPESSSSIILISYLLGYPNAAKCISKLYKDNTISYNVCKKLFAFTNNASPAYILGSIGLGLFNNIDIGILLLISHFLASVLIGISYPYSKDIIQQNVTNSNSFNKISSPFDILLISLLNSLKTLGVILGFTIIFSLIPILFFNKLNLPDIFYGLLVGLFEITNGIKILSEASASSKIILCTISFILSFSSLMVIMQVHSFGSKTNIKLKHLIIFKFIHGILSTIITYLLLQTNLFNISLTTNANANVTTNTITATNINYLYLLIIFLTTTLLYLILKKKR